MESLPEDIEQRLEHIGTADIVIGIPTFNNVAGVDGAVSAVQSGLHGGFATARGVIVHVEAGSREALQGAPELPAAGDGAQLQVLRFAQVSDGVGAGAPGAWSNPAKAGACRAVFEVARRLRAKACSIVDTDAGAPQGDAIARLVKPVVHDSYDFAAPVYARGPFSGVITTGVVYPLTRALFGKRVRQPLAGDFACSARLLERFVALDPGRSDVQRMGIDFWVTTQAMTAGARLCQVHLGPRAPSALAEVGAGTVDLRDTLPRVLGHLFASVERTDSLWQKVRGSEPVDAFGTPDAAPASSSPFDVAQCLDVFRLGAANLHELWSIALPPTQLHAVRKLAAQPGESFRMPDELWARLVYDFALAFHQRKLGREHLLSAFTPLFLAWLASYSRQAEAGTGAALEARVEELCLRFEGEKPYFIGRWRSPDRFAP